MPWVVVEIGQLIRDNLPDADSLGAVNQDAHVQSVVDSLPQHPGCRHVQVVVLVLFDYLPHQVEERVLRHLGLAPIEAPDVVQDLDGSLTVRAFLNEEPVRGLGNQQNEDEEGRAVQQEEEGEAVLDVSAEFEQEEVQKKHIGGIVGHDQSGHRVLGTFRDELQGIGVGKATLEVEEPLTEEP
jgi:hypothetical protein